VGPAKLRAFIPSAPQNDRQRHPKEAAHYQPLYFFLES
jgi:hypothetical protein